MVENFNNAGETPLMVACKEGKFEMVKFIFEHYKAKRHEYID